MFKFGPIQHFGSKLDRGALFLQLIPEAKLQGRDRLMIEQCELDLFFIVFAYI